VQVYNNAACKSTGALSLLLLAQKQTVFADTLDPATNRIFSRAIALFFFIAIGSRNSCRTYLLLYDSAAMRELSITTTRTGDKLNLLGGLTLCLLINRINHTV